MLIVSKFDQLGRDAINVSKGSFMPLKFLFVSGSHKSGTSWLALMLNGHPNIHISRQELWLFGHPNSIEGRAREALEKWIALPTISQQFPTENDVIRARNSVIRGAVRGAMSATAVGMDNIKVLGDKTPYFYSVSASAVHEVFPDAYFIHLVRDPRDVIVSHHYHMYRLQEFAQFGRPERAEQMALRIKENKDVGVELLDDKLVVSLAQNWVQVQQGAVKAKELYKEKYFASKYEDLIENGHELITAMYRHLGLDTEAALVDEIIEKYSFRSLAKGRRAGVQDNTSFFRKGIVGDWKNHFADEAEETVRRICADAAKPYGYFQE